MTAILRLRERCPRLCRLAPDEVRHLLEHHRGHLDLAPTTDRHVWRVTPGGIAGVLLTPRRRVVIEAKIPLSNLLYLFDAPSTGHPLHTIEEVAAIDALAERLADLMLRRAAAGLHRGYREQTHQGPYLVGRLDLAAQLREPPGRRDQLHSRYDAFTLDLPCNLVPKALARRLASAPLLNEEIRALLRQARAAFEPVRDEGLSDDLLAQLRREPAPADYVALIDLCVLLTSLLGSGVDGASALLVSLERWFERYVSRAIVDRFGSAAQTQRVALVGEPGVVVRPDVTLDRPGRSPVVLDAKWKRPGAGGPESGDLYQVLAYAGLLGADHAILIYPGRGRRRVLRFDRMPTRVHLWRLDAAGSLDRCRRSRERFLDKLDRL